MPALVVWLSVTAYGVVTLRYITTRWGATVMISVMVAAAAVASRYIEPAGVSWTAIVPLTLIAGLFAGIRPYPPEKR